jgi:hypothetical protein
MVQAVWRRSSSSKQTSQVGKTRCSWLGVRKRSVDGGIRRDELDSDSAELILDLSNDGKGAAGRNAGLFNHFRQFVEDAKPDVTKFQPRSVKINRGASVWRPNNLGFLARKGWSFSSDIVSLSGLAAPWKRRPCSKLRHPLHQHHVSRRDLMSLGGLPNGASCTRQCLQPTAVEQLDAQRCHH